MSSALEDLYMDIGQKYEQPKKPFEIEDQGGAIWALRKIKIIDANLREAEEAAENEFAMIQEWLDGERKKATDERAFFENLLYKYFNKKRQENPKMKSLALPGGRLRVKKQQPLYRYDENEIIPWAEEYLPDAVRIKKEVNKNVVKRHIKETGEFVPGVNIVDRPELFEVEVKRND